MSAEPIPASTLIVVRDRAAGPAEILMVERAGGMAFAAGALVFPGGRIDPEDQALGDRLGTDASRIAAIRETIEETGLPVALTPLPEPSTALLLQQGLVAGAAFEQLLCDHHLAIDAGALVPFARWVPKFHAVRRFDTMFFIARSPDGDYPLSLVENECAAAHWMSAAEVLDREKSGEAKLIFPTRRNLERLARHSDFDALKADSQRYPVEPVTPWVESHDGEDFITIPDHLGYPVTREKLDGVWRG